MWTLILLSVLGLLTLYGLFKAVIKPYKLYKYYANQLKQKNYKCYQVPFIPFIAPSVINSLREQKQFKDGLYAAKFQGPKYDMILTNLASQIVLILVSPKLLQQFYLLDGTSTYMKEQSFITSLKRVARNSITFSQGQVWKSKRKFITSFLNFNFINKEFPTIVDIVNRKLNEAAKGREEFQVYILELLEQITSSTIVELFFGGGSTDAENLQIEGVRVSSYMRVMMEHLGEQALDPVSFLIGQSFPQKNLRAKDRLVTHQVQKYKEFTKNFIRNRIYEIQQGISKKQDYVKRIYQSIKPQQRTPQFIQKVMYDFSSLYIAGTDTTSHSAMMVLYYLIMHEDKRNKLMEEINTHIKSDDDVCYEKIKDMVYLECAIYQALRIYQPANGIFIREATQDHLLGDIKVLKGTLLMTSSLSNHYNPEYFQNPTQYIPERWLDQKGQVKTAKPFTWLTFSAGARSCLGKQLALTELKIIVIQFLRKYEMKMQTTDLTMKMESFSYQPQQLLTKFVKK